MLGLGRGGRRWLFGSLVLLGAPLATHAAQAHGSHGRTVHAAHEGVRGERLAGRSHAERPGYAVRTATWLHGSGEGVRFTQGAYRFGGGSGAYQGRYASAYRGASVLQCVAFAREDSGIALSGNAADWWNNASGIYARGTRPESGSVLSFRANGRMRLGHVAVVSRVINARTLEVDHSHWMGDGVSRDMAVVDVSENNDWSAVRVELGHSGAYGSIYPTHGFIYDRPDAGRFEASNGTAPMPVMDAAPRDLRGHRRATVAAFEEVAEAPVSGRGIDLSTASFDGDAPSRSLR
ncbi:MAG: CHAP domain-containing protein [Janthinobacterium lividum]